MKNLITIITVIMLLQSAAIAQELRRSGTSSARPGRHDFILQAALGNYE